VEWTEIEQRWADLAAQARRRWHLLSDDDVRHVGGRRLKLIGRVQRRYHLPFRAAKAQVAAWRQELR
jgi:hypothetical protein